jgi:hypothetical protein
MSNRDDKTSTFDFDGADVRNVEMRRVESDADEVVSARASNIDRLMISDVLHGRGEGRWYRAAMLVLTVIIAVAAVLVLFV